MQISANINSNVNRCCRPDRRLNFEGRKESRKPEEKMRHKHFEQLSDDILCVRSTQKAAEQINQSPKAKLLKAMPALTAGLTGITIGLTQPGKLSSKVTSGLGFLAALKSVNLVTDSYKKALTKDITNEKNPNSKKHTGLLTLGLAALGVGALGAASAIKGTNAGNFIEKETSKLAGELNATKLGYFTQNVIEPFIQKHPKLNGIMSLVLPVGSIVAGGITEAHLAKNLTQDFQNKANENFLKSKEVQRIAREEFDAIDAKEV